VLIGLHFDNASLPSLTSCPRGIRIRSIFYDGVITLRNQVLVLVSWFMMMRVLCHEQRFCDDLSSVRVLSRRHWVVLVDDARSRGWRLARETIWNPDDQSYQTRQLALWKAWSGVLSQVKQDKSEWGRDYEMNNGRRACWILCF
jgi:hypothetical protein